MRTLVSRFNCVQPNGLPMLLFCASALNVLMAGTALAGQAQAPATTAAQIRASAFDATHMREPHDLDSLWLVHGSDDPAYGHADFDDSQWVPFDPHSSIIALYEKTRPEIVWYRQRVRVDPGQTGLALRERSISRAFEVYVNGERFLASGQVEPFKSYSVGARRLKRIPDRMMASGTIVIALRVHISRSEWTIGQDPGYFATNLTLGQESALYRDTWLAVIGENLFSWIDTFMQIALGAVALVLFLAQRRQMEYLWIFALGALRVAEFPYEAITLFHDIPVVWQILSGSLRIATPFFWASMYFAFVGQRIGWRFRIFLVLAGILNAYSWLEGLFGAAPSWLQPFINLPFYALLSVITPIVLIVHLRRGNREAGILLIPVTLFSLFLYAVVALQLLFQFPAWRTVALKGFDLVDRFPAGPFFISLDNVSGILFALSLAVIMVLRSTSMSRRQAQLEGELAAAQQVQQVLLPEQVEAVPGFVVESVYQPAQQVGGDFFQILPAGDGGLLLVVGDVAGKGLPAAMMVSLLVGSIRTAAEDTDDPQTLLSKLNERLVGRSGGAFSTALAAHISSQGKVTIANAGHLSPYLDGREMELHPALPLGILSGAHYEKSYFQLAPGSRLTFYSDGVIEAQNAKGELFGFERGREISTRPASAIVETAMRFGQSDDITVVAITRSATVAAAA